MSGPGISRVNPAGSAGSSGLWRYRDLLPQVAPVTLGEGWTPLLRSVVYPGLYVKEEGLNPTGSWQARGMSVAVAQARHDGVRHVACAGTGELAVALAAYAAAAGLHAHVYLPQDAGFACIVQVAAHGAEIQSAEGSLADCTRLLAERIASVPKPWLDLSAPRRLAGAKTLGYELCEQLDWQYPDAVFLPADAFSILSQAFDDLERLGWMTVGSKRPRLYAGIADAPSFYAHEGVLLSPEGAAGLAHYEHLLDTGELTAEHRVVLVNPASGLDVDRIATELQLRRPVKLPWSMPVGGIITPV